MLIPSDALIPALEDNCNPIEINYEIAQVLYQYFNSHCKSLTYSTGTSLGKTWFQKYFSCCHIIFVVFDSVIDFVQAERFAYLDAGNKSLTCI